LPEGLARRRRLTLDAVRPEREAEPVLRSVLDRCHRDEPAITKEQERNVFACRIAEGRCRIGVGCAECGEFALPGIGRAYDVAADGQRFIMVKDSDDAGGGRSRHIVAVFNWVEELKRLVPGR
jgi:hypothetical protein